MNNNKKTCRKCKGQAKESSAFINYHNIQYPYDGSLAEFEIHLVKCMKCMSCGHSWINAKSSENNLSDSTV